MERTFPLGPPMRGRAPAADGRSSREAVSGVVWRGAGRELRGSAPTCGLANRLSGLRRRGHRRRIGSGHRRHLCMDLRRDAGKPPTPRAGGRPVDDIFACVGERRRHLRLRGPRMLRSKRGAIYTRAGRYNIKRAQHKFDFGPLEEGCDCYTCQHYSRAYVDHPLRAREFNGSTLATIHNEHFFVKLLDDIRARSTADTLMSSATKRWPTSTATASAGQGCEFFSSLRLVLPRSD